MLPSQSHSANRLLRVTVAVVLLGWSLLGCGSRSSVDLEAWSTHEPTDVPIAGVPSAEPTPPVEPPRPPEPQTPVEPPRPPEPQTPPDPPQPCESVTLTIDELRPRVTLLVDQSGSMRFRYPTRDSDETRWSTVRNALFHEMTGVVRNLEHSMHFGLALYTSHNGFSSGTCPIVTQVGLSTGNYEATRTLFDAMSPDDDTPTGAALAAIVEQLHADSRQSPNVILLVTDGDPDTCEVPDPQTEAGQSEAVAAATAAFEAEIGLYVLGISDDISGDKLQQLANAGQGKPLDAVWGVDPDAAQPFLASDDVAGLTAQLLEILGRVPLCEVGLNRDVDAEELATASVILDGEQLPFNESDGFEQSGPRRLRITGQACEALRASGKELAVRISCE